MIHQGDGEGQEIKKEKGKGGGLTAETDRFWEGQ